ncbi:unnamed protein product [Rotaria sordida]|uniref:Uncharacterized protein n=1 Tax=Rotaria sordida TaxID=392033 RepID=A0A814DIE9_9BILA|nr:unnamed protein product [Rotaria sordida]CAF0953421.1 unnamed protein product [Rotaria sordida]CAF0956954.1 unnamed protein product [Rotaria sordida]
MKYSRLLQPMNRIQPLKTELLFNNLLSANIGSDSINGTFARICCDSLDSIDKGYPYSQSDISITDESISSKSIEVFFPGVDY